MKIRTGFVSNSSSSNFIVAFPHKPKSVEDVKEMMFGKQEWHFVDFYGGKGICEVLTKDIAKSVFSDIEGRKKATKKQMIKSLKEGNFEYYIDEEILPGQYSNWEDVCKLDYKTEHEKIWSLFEEADKINDQRVAEIVEVFMIESKGQWITTLCYSDEEGQWGGIMEHTNIFNRLDCVKTNCH